MRPIWLVVAVLGTSCSSNANVVSADIGPEGGILQADCGTLDVLPGALEQSTRVDIESVTVELGEPLEAKSLFCRVDFGDAELLAPAQLTLTYDTDEFPDDQVPATLIAIGRPGLDVEWSTVWMPALPSAGLLPSHIAAPGLYGPALVLANNPTCLASISFCAAITGPAPALPAPATWMPIPGTSAGQYEMDSLYKYVNNPGYLSEGLCALNLACLAEYLPPDVLLDIQVMCSRLPCPYDLVCAARIVNEYLAMDESNVCRHYAWALREAAAILGRTANFECGWYDSVGHAWVVVEWGGITYYMDAFAQTYVSDGPVPPMCENLIVETGEQCDGDASVCAVPSECVDCQCVAIPFPQCAGIPDQNDCLACCEGAATSPAELDTCTMTHCQ